MKQKKIIIKRKQLDNTEIIVSRHIFTKEGIENAIKSYIKSNISYHATMDNRCMDTKHLPHQLIMIILY